MLINLVFCLFICAACGVAFIPQQRPLYSFGRVPLDQADSGQQRDVVEQPAANVARKPAAVAQSAVEMVRKLLIEHRADGHLKQPSGHLFVDEMSEDVANAVLAGTDDSFDQLVDHVARLASNVYYGLQASANATHARQFARALLAHQVWLADQAAAGQGSPVVAANPPFQCAVDHVSPDRPTNVNQLKFGDITVVGAMGDSITAGFAAKAKSIFGIFTEYRGVVYSAGGDDSLPDVLTMPNILKRYQPAITGWARGSGSATSSNARFDKAVTGSVANDMPGQAVKLVDALKADLTADQFQNDWKLITVFVGGNDLCAYCSKPEQHSAANYKQKLTETMAYLKQNVPRLMVNLVTTIDVTQLYVVSSGFCSLLHAYECSCGVSSDSSVRQAVSDESKNFHAAADAIASDPQFADADDFTIVVQPFMSNTHVPKKSDGSPDMAYFAPDCFHFSALGHEGASVALWNNMVQPVGQKETSWEGPGEQLLCPEPNSFIPTITNSK